MNHFISDIALKIGQIGHSLEKRKKQFVKGRELYFDVMYGLVLYIIFLYSMLFTSGSCFDKYLKLKCEGYVSRLG